MQIQVNTGKAELLFVKVPEDARDFKVANGPNHWVKYLYSIEYLGDGELYMGEIKLIELPRCRWQIIGLANELTEEHCEPLVESIYELSLTQYGVYLSAKESFESLMEANEIYSVNPYGDEPKDVPHLGAWTQYWRQKWQEWNKAEERTGKWLVLKCRRTS